MNWEEISLEDQERTETPCDCCSAVTTEIIGHLNINGAYHSWYCACWSDSHPEQPLLLTVYTGDFSKTGHKDTRWATRIHVKLGEESGCMLLDWPECELDGNALFTPLNRDDILGSDYAPVLWACVDAVLMKETRLEHMRQ